MTMQAAYGDLFNAAALKPGITVQKYDVGMKYATTQI